MGFGIGDLELIIRLKKEGYILDRAAIVEIGAQQMSNTMLKAEDRVNEIGRLFNVTEPFPLAAPKLTHITHGALEHLDTAAPFTRDFWTWLGFDYASIDIDGSPMSIPLDFNYDSAPRDAVGKFNLVTNYGTTEHVVNQLNAFKIIHELTAVRGIMIHALPAQGMINHGLVNYNPKFFWMLARSNGYKWLYMNLQIEDATPYPIPQNIIDLSKNYEPDIVERLGHSKIADGILVVVMQKVFDIPYVAPIDVPTGATTDNDDLKKRYWTVFNPDAFARIPNASVGSKFKRLALRLYSQTLAAIRIS